MEHLLPKELMVKVLSKLDFEYLETLTPEEAAEEVEGIIVQELFKRMALKLSPFYKMGNLKTPGETHYKLINLELIFSNIQRTYQDGYEYPVKKMLARYRGLCNLGSKSLAYAESQKELMTTSYQHPIDPAYLIRQYELDPTQLSGYIVDLVINMPDVIPPIM